VILVVGVNGSGKTTTIAKLAGLLLGEGRKVLLGAADTFRAAAGEQLRTWANRIGVDVVVGEEGADPASVTHDAITAARARGAEVVIIDTAGRLHAKRNLMAELGKIRRVAESESGVDEVLLVLDATTGQNGLVQVREFAAAVELTGVVLTKLDGTAKGGIVIAVERELGVPVKFVGTGESVADLTRFDPDRFVAQLMEAR
jgi:fused signal recognition particle receptor